MPCLSGGFDASLSPLNCLCSVFKVEAQLLKSLVIPTSPTLNTPTALALQHSSPTTRGYKSWRRQNTTAAQLPTNYLVPDHLRSIHHRDMKHNLSTSNN